jgi:bacillithiol system protein YtxJ
MFMRWLFGRTKGDSTMIEITSVEALETVLAKSSDGPVVLFKHSTRCPTSGAAYARVDKWLRESGENAPKVYLVKVIESRPVSNAIAERLGVTHQSPQTIVVRNGRSVWNASHGQITGEAIANALTVAD